jgi:chromosome segregation ATPase
VCRIAKDAGAEVIQQREREKKSLQDDVSALLAQQKKACDAAAAKDAELSKVAAERDAKATELQQLQETRKTEKAHLDSEVAKLVHLRSQFTRLEAEKTTLTEKLAALDATNRTLTAKSAESASAAAEHEVKKAECADLRREKAALFDALEAKKKECAALKSDITENARVVGEKDDLLAKADKQVADLTCRIRAHETHQNLCDKWKAETVEKHKALEAKLQRTQQEVEELTGRVHRRDIAIGNAKRTCTMYDMLIGALDDPTIFIQKAADAARRAKDADVAKLAVQRVLTEFFADVDAAAKAAESAPATTTTTSSSSSSGGGGGGGGGGDAWSNGDPKPPGLDSHSG